MPSKPPLSLFGKIKGLDVPTTFITFCTDSSCCTRQPWAVLDYFIDSVAASLHRHKSRYGNRRTRGEINSHVKHLILFFVYFTRLLMPLSHEG